MRIVVALGGNALLPPYTKTVFEHQIKAIKKTASLLASLAKKHEIIITHGNGPQVGLLLEQQKFSKMKKPLDVCGSESQGQIGYMLQQNLNNEFSRRKMLKKAVSIITQVEVLASDPAFKHPSKPVGPYYSVLTRVMSKEDMKYFPRKGYRKLVPSPYPIKIIELPQIEYLIEKGFVVICCGGGGIPVTRQMKKYTGTIAVIDKDRTAALLARKIDADMLVMLTDVDAAYINYNQKNEKKILEISERNLKEYLKLGYFAEGSMKPKVEAAIDFVSKMRKPAVIGNLSSIMDVINKKNCTVVLP